MFLLQIGSVLTMQLHQLLVVSLVVSILSGNVERVDEFLHQRFIVILVVSHYVHDRIKLRECPCFYC